MADAFFNPKDTVLYQDSICKCKICVCSPSLAKHNNCSNMR